MSVRNEKSCWHKLEAVLKKFVKFASPNYPFKIQSTGVCQRAKTSGGVKASPTLQKERKTPLSEKWPKHRENVGISSFYEQPTLMPPPPPPPPPPQQNFKRHQGHERHARHISASKQSSETKQRQPLGVNTDWNGK